MRRISESNVTARDGQEVQFTLFEEKGEKCETFLVEARPMGVGYGVDAGETFEFVSEYAKTAGEIFERFVEAGKRAPTKCGHYLVCPAGFRRR